MKPKFIKIDKMLINISHITSIETFSNRVDMYKIVINEDADYPRVYTIDEDIYNKLLENIEIID